MRFNVIHNEEETIGISLYEACRDMAPFDHRMTMPHFIRWQDTLTHRSASPPRGA